MANNKTTYVLEIDAEVSQLKSKLETTKATLDKLGDSSFSTGMGKKITSILTQLDKLQKKASQPIDSKATFSSLEKGFGSIVVDAKNLLGELEKISSMVTREKFSLLPEDEAKRLKEAFGAVQAYTKAVEKAEKARIRSQEKRKGERESTSTQLNEAREIHKKAKASYDGATAKGTEYGDAKAIVAQSEAAKKAQKEIDSLEKQLKKYQKRLEELNGIENKTEEQETELQTIRSNIKSVGGKIGARKKIIKNIPDEKTLTAANKTIEEYTPAIEALEQSVAQAEKEITRLENALAKLDEAIKSNSTEITSSQADYKVLYEQAKKLGVSLEGVTEDVNPTNIRILTERMRDLVNEGVKPLDDVIEEVTPDIKELGDVATQTGEKISSAEEHFSSMVDNQSRIDNLKENIKQFIGWAGASKVLSAAMRNAFEDVKELDKAMTEIAVVTDFDIGDMWDQMPTYTARANELGLEITEVYEASALFYQQGLDTNEMIALSNETLKMAKIAGLDAAEATDRMTAALRGFNMELDEASAQKVADVYSELAAITASDVDEISSAMTKTASIASSAGMEFETTAAFLSQIIETTRESAETAGTAMKTVIARFQELKKSPDEIGEIDGEIVDANQIEKALRSVGVSLRDTGGQFRELDDVFLELSSKWDGLDKNTQRYIATIAAGSRQQSRFIAMMSNYARTQELVTAANNSAGASQKQYEKTMESIETKLKKLENAWTEFSTGLMNSDVVKFAVDFLTSLLNALNRVTQGFEGFTGSLSKVGTMIAIFQTAKAVVGKFFDEIIAKIYLSAVKAGENIAKGTEDGINKRKQVETEDNGLFGRKKLSKGLGQLKEAKNKKDFAKFEENYYKQEAEEVKKYWGENSKEAITAIEEYEEAKKRTIQVEEEADQISQEGLKNITEGAQTAGQAIAMVGVGLGVVGQMFSEAGNEEAAKFFQDVGNIFTFVGSAIMGVAALIPAFTTIFSGLVDKLVAGGISTQAAWGWVTLIVVAVTALVIGVVAIVNAINNASPEAKLEKAQEAADKAAKAAERATEAYENLKSVFEELGNGYEALEDLTRGTKEWNEAVKQINKSVLDLIQQYPELAKFVDNESGVLTIDLDDDNVQQVLKNAENSAIVAQNSSTLANLNVVRAEDNVERNKLSTSERIGHYETYGNSTVWVEEKANTEALAKALAQGTVINSGNSYQVTDTDELARLGISESQLEQFYKQTGKNSDGLKEFGESLLETQAQEEAAFAAVATSAYQLANTLDMTEQEQAQASNIVDDASVKKMYDENMSDLEGIDFTAEEGSNAITDDQRKMRDDAIRAQYGADARIEGNKVTFRDANGQQTEELTNDEIKAMVANNMTTKETTKAIEMAPETVDHVISAMGFSKDSKEAKAIESAAMDQEGDNLTADEAATLGGLDDKKLKQIYNEMSEEQKNIFGSQEEYLKKIKGAGEIAAGAFENAGKGAEKIGLITIENGKTAAESFSETFGFMTADMAKGFTSKMEEVWKVSGEEGVKQFKNAYNTMIEGQSEEIAAEITALLNGIDWTNQEDLLKFQTILYEKYGMSREETENLITTMGDAAKATSSLTTVIETFGALYQSTQKIESATRKLSDLQWDYERLLKSGASAAELAANKEKQRQVALTKGEEALAAYEHARDNASKIYASGVNLSGVGEDLTKYVHFNPENGYYEVSELQKRINEGFFGTAGSEERKAVEDYVARLDEANDIAFEQLDIARESYEEIEALNEESEKSYNHLVEIAKDSILATMEKDISVQEDILDATEETGEKIVSKIQEQIDTERQERENERARENISDLQQRIAYLGMDTSGAADLERLQLNEALAEQEEDYLDSLIDQSLESIQDANAKAAEQREQQIALQQAQLDLYKTSNKIEEDAKSIVKQFLEEVQKGVNVKEAADSTGLISDALLEGMGVTEENDLIDQLGTDAAAVISAQDKVSGSLVDGSDSAANLLSQINQKTTNDLLGQILYRDQLAAAGEKENKFKNKTKFDIAGDSDIKGYMGPNGFNTTTAQSYVDTVNTITSSNAQDKLVEANKAGVNIYDKYSKYGYTTTDGFLDEDTFYSEINAGKTLDINGVKFNKEILTGSLSHGSTSGSYGDYMQHWEFFGIQDEGQKQEEALQKAKEYVLSIQKSNTFRGMETLNSDSNYLKLKNQFLDFGGTEDKFLSLIRENIQNGAVNDVTVKYSGSSVKMNINGKEDEALLGNRVTDPNILAKLTELVGSIDTSKQGWAAMVDGQLYVVKNYQTGSPHSRYTISKAGWYSTNTDGNASEVLRTRYLNALRGISAYKTGGLADFTGPAWLDGTPSRPEYILNAEQTKRFFSLIDILEGFDIKSSTTSNSNDISVDVDINVENIGSDYDVEQLANKIRSMLRDDAMYRNVNNINQVR